MSDFSPRCPICGKTDMVRIYVEKGKIWLDKYYCARCDHVFPASNGYTPYTASSYHVTGGTVDVASGSNRFIVTDE